VGGSVEDYHAFPRKALFDKIGMDSAVLEVDAIGTFVGSSFMYATARDWARFGLLYLHDGVCEGERILPPGWVSYSTMPSSSGPIGRYGAHFWTNGGNMPGGKAKPLEKLPPDTFYAAGYEGQYIVIIPSRKLVVVRLGMTRNIKAWDMESFVSDVLAAIAVDENASGGRRDEDAGAGDSST
jgi:CubicO group peptidase (beta-lactamase class C family)